MPRLRCCLVTLSRSLAAVIVATAAVECDHVPAPLVEGLCKVPPVLVVVDVVSGVDDGGHAGGVSAAFVQ